jgi:hypothetical protein
LYLWYTTTFKKMRTIILFLITLFYLDVNAQSGIPNSDFETWSTFGQPPTDFQDPQDWTSTNGSVVFTTTPIDKTTDKYHGTYAAEIKAVQVFGMMPPSILCNGTVPADFQTYSIDFVKAGTPYPGGHVFSIDGEYKYSRDTAFQDSAYAIILLKKYNVALQKIDTVAIGSKVFAPASSFTFFTIPFNYLPGNLTPDSIVVAFCNQARVMKQMQPTGKFIVDWVSANSGLGTPRLQKSISVNTFPNPFKNITNFYLEGIRPDPSRSLQLEVYDVLGKKVDQLPIEKEKFIYSRNSLPDGMYFYKVKENETVLYTGKLVFE